MFEGHGSYTTWAFLACFDWRNYINGQNRLPGLLDKSARLDEHQRLRRRPPKSIKNVSLLAAGPSVSEVLVIFFFCFFAALSGPEREAWKLFLVLFRHSVVLRSDSTMCTKASDLWRRTVDLQSWSSKGFGEEMTETQWTGLAWSVRSSAEVSVHVSSNFFALNDRRDRQTELRNAAP